MNKFLLSFAIFLLAFSACKEPAATVSPFVQIAGKQFTLNNADYYFIGTNYWHGAILGSVGEGGNRAKLIQELDFMKANGITNLRILVGADGVSGVPSKVEPTLQTAPGVYNDTIFDGLDFLLSEMGKRQMVAVLYLNNSWEWSGGYSAYLEWATGKPSPIPSIDGWPAFMSAMAGFVQSEPAKALFAKHVDHVIQRTNRYTNLKYINDPAIMSWQIGNEPRAFSDVNKSDFASWIAQSAAQIRNLDKNHLISVGSEGSWGCENDIALWKQIHTDPNIDYLTMHAWAFNWGWVKKDSIVEGLASAIPLIDQYIDSHIAIADQLNKPVVLEEFGLPRDGFQFTPNSPTQGRDALYTHIFERIVTAARTQSAFAGCNFWAWAGTSRPNPQHVFWQKGDDYMGDPAQEEQGLNAVYDTDSTVGVIRNFSTQLDSQFSHSSQHK